MARVIRGGGIVAYPTDTNYGLGCLVTLRESVERLYRVKHVDPSKPMSLVCNSFEMVSRFAVIENGAYRILRRTLPGPYTFVLRATGETPKRMLTRQKTIGIRIPRHAFCLALTEDLGTPLISTTAQIGEDETLYDPGTLDDRYEGALDLVVDGGILPAEPSTVVDLTSGVPVVVRLGKGPIDLI